MNPNEIKLPNFPRHAKDGDKAVIKFYSPFHSVTVDANGIVIENNEDYDNTLLGWRYFIEEKLQESNASEFQAMYEQTLKKLSEL